MQKDDGPAACREKDKAKPEFESSASFVGHRINQPSTEKTVVILESKFLKLQCG